MVTENSGAVCIQACVCVCVCFPQCPEVKGTHYLCVDSVGASQVLISFSALLVWGDTAGESKNPDMHVHMHNTHIKVLNEGVIYYFYFYFF